MTPNQRKRCMSRIKGKNTKPEMMLRKALWAAGLRYRLKNSLPGNPDIVFPGKKIAIFVDGCFWHRCPKHFQLPKNNAQFWMDKIARNVERDRQADRNLQAEGWQVLRIWEHDVHDSLEACVAQIKTMVYGK
jgi:DNA mismatch endonuclease (patch repair protein)